MTKYAVGTKVNYKNGAVAVAQKNGMLKIVSGPIRGYKKRQAQKGGGNVVTQWCQNCGGNGGWNCQNCGGNGGWNCQNCDGNGSNECFTCAYGYGANSFTYDGSNCSECGGTGSENCQNCDGDGWWTCNPCQGQGWHVCNVCDGTGF